MFRSARSLTQMGLEYLQSIMIARNFFNLQQICLLSLGTDHVVPFEMTHIDITNIYTRDVTIVDTILSTYHDCCRHDSQQAIASSHYRYYCRQLRQLIDFSDSCLCGLKLISFRQKKQQMFTSRCLTLVIYVLLIMNICSRIVH